MRTPLAMISSPVSIGKGFILLLVAADISLACEGVDCNWGVCVPTDDDGGYRCNCLAGYGGEQCNELLSSARFARSSSAACTYESCSNGGTCMDLTDADGEAASAAVSGMGESGLDVGDGEAAVEGEAADYETEMKATAEFVCLCTPGFTGPTCSGIVKQHTTQFSKQKCFENLSKKHSPTHVRLECICALH